MARSTRPEEVVPVAMAQVMSGMPDVWRRLLAEHVPDQHGRCQACRDESGASASWPCLTRQIAEQAKRIHDGPHPEFPPPHSPEWQNSPGSLGGSSLAPTEWESDDTPLRSVPLGSVPLGPIAQDAIPAGPAPVGVTPPGPPPLRAISPPLPGLPPDLDVLPQVEYSSEPHVPRSTGRHAAP